MTDKLNISIDWKPLEEGTEEERACFGQFNLRHGNLLLTEGLDGFIECDQSGPLVSGPLVSGYHLSEWLAWNWWRLVSEPRPLQPTPEWEFAHRLATIGAGYVWPNITIFSDRERTALVAKPTHPQGFTPFRFTADWTVVLPTKQFEAAVELFLTKIQGQLRAKSVTTTNFDRIWKEIQGERANPETATRRRLEALLGFDPDEDTSDLIERFLADASNLGLDAVQEIAADHQHHITSIATDIDALARTYGSKMNPADMVRLTAFESLPREQVPAWRRGYESARALREQQNLGLNPLENHRLAELCGVSTKALEPAEGANFAFSLDDASGKSGSVVLRARWETGRRFELARLLGDRLTNGLMERLLPATRSYTYRQKLQRAFAAELLCPFEALEEKLAGDYSADAREDAAQHFNVSERTVTTMLVNHRRMDRDYLEGDFDGVLVA